MRQEKTATVRRSGPAKRGGPKRGSRAWWNQFSIETLYFVAKYLKASEETRAKINTILGVK